MHAISDQQGRRRGNPQSAVEAGPIVVGSGTSWTWVEPGWNLGESWVSSEWYLMKSGGRDLVEEGELLYQWLGLFLYI